MINKKTGWYSAGGGGENPPPYVPEGDAIGSVYTDIRYDTPERVNGKTYNLEGGRIYVPLDNVFPSVSGIPGEELIAGGLVSVSVEVNCPGYEDEYIYIEAGRVVRTFSAISKAVDISTSSVFDYSDIYPIPVSISSCVWSGRRGTYVLPVTDQPVIYPPGAGGGIFRHPGKWVGITRGQSTSGKIEGATSLEQPNTIMNDLIASQSAGVVVNNNTRYRTLLQAPSDGCRGTNPYYGGGNTCYIGPFLATSTLYVHFTQERNIVAFNPIPYMKTGPWGRFWRITPGSNTAQITDWVIY